MSAIAGNITVVHRLTNEVADLIIATNTAREVYQAKYNDLWRNYFDSDQSISACDKLARIFSQEEYQQFRRLEAELEATREYLTTERAVLNHAIQAGS